VSSAASQPFESLLSQLPNPLEHEPIAHARVAQVAVALARVHIDMHAPQLSSRSSETSQPFASVPSQSSKPALHDSIRQVPPVHDAIAFDRVHAVPHAPQC
jgi:hypothetical protein